MSELFVDTNVFLRFLTADVLELAQDVDRLLERAEGGEISLCTSILTIAEIVWTLESYYELPRDEILEKVIAILNTPGLDVEGSDLLAQAVSLYVDQNIDFIDAYNGIWMRERGLSKAVTFDVKHFSRIGGITAISPKEVV